MHKFTESVCLYVSVASFIFGHMLDRLGMGNHVLGSVKGISRLGLILFT